MPSEASEHPLPPPPIVPTADEVPAAPEPLFETPVADEPPVLESPASVPPHDGPPARGARLHLPPPPFPL